MNRYLEHNVKNFKMKSFLKKLIADLQQKSSTIYKKNVLRFFTGSINCIGVPKADAVTIGKRHFVSLKPMSQDMIFAHCQELFEQNILELSGIACDWAYACEKQYEKNDFKLFELWLKDYIHDWAVCDTFCATVLKAYFIQFPQEIEKMNRWVTAQNPYMRRASAVALIYFDPQGHLQLRLQRAKVLMYDEDLFVQKGYGWLLKKTSQKFPQEVYNFVIKHKKVMPRLALRYAIEKLPKQLRAQAMLKD